MNQLFGVVSDYHEADGISFVKVDSGEIKLGVMSLGKKWSIGDQVRAYFKESDVLIAHKQSQKLSARNKFLSPVYSVEENGVLARIEFDFFGKKISSLISYEAFLELGITPGEEFLWFVKSNEIILERI